MMSYTQLQSNMPALTVKEAHVIARHRMIAEETLLILERGWYDHPQGGRVWIADDLARSVAGTRMWAPEQSQAALDEITRGVRRGQQAPPASPDFAVLDRAPGAPTFSAFASALTRS
jgi:hypothetical protein